MIYKMNILNKFYQEKDYLNKLDTIYYQYKHFQQNKDLNSGLICTIGEFNDSGLWIDKTYELCPFCTSEPDHKYSIKHFEYIYRLNVGELTSYITYNRQYDIEFLVEYNLINSYISYGIISEVLYEKVYLFGDFMVLFHQLGGYEKPDLNKKWRWLNELIEIKS